MRLTRFIPLVVLALVVSRTASSQEAGSVVSDTGLPTGSAKLRLKAEIKLNVRSSAAEEVRLTVAGASEPVFLRTVAPHTSLEVSDVALTGEADLTADLTSRFTVHVLDLYNRNPTSSDDRIFIREAWLRAGKKLEALQPSKGTSVYVQVGKFPRFSKQLNRRFENYGLWGTAVGRFEEVGLEAGGTFGTHVYWRGQAVNGNPLFFRDPNALAGDNGTPERKDFATQNPIYQSGFPILYDAKAQDLNASGRFQVGGGLGFKWSWGEGDRDGVDVLGWVFSRQLAEKARIRGTFYDGDLGLLRGFPGGVSLPVDGNDKIEYGANLEARLGRFQLYGQCVHQEIAGLKRSGYEVEAAYRIPLNGLFVSGDSPVLNWIQPVVRVSRIDNDFDAPAGFVAPSMAWDWSKYDFGFRLGIVRGVDLTAEYARHEARARARIVYPDEFLLTLRAGF